MLRAFRYLSLIEGLSLILLFFVAMPAKYYFGYPGLVPIVGMTHGLLFLVYISMSLSTSHQQNWSVGFWLLTLLSSVIPFACFFLDRKLKSMESETETTASVAEATT